jgi:predicted RNA binding protein YcfA (HicA-like mRNA interferase family)
VSRLRPVEARRLLAFLTARGFRVVGQTGSHVKLRGGDGRLLVVPCHARRPVKAGLVFRILKQAGLDPHEALDSL